MSATQPSDSEQRPDEPQPADAPQRTPAPASVDAVFGVVVIGADDSEAVALLLVLKLERVP